MSDLEAPEADAADQAATVPAAPVPTDDLEPDLETPEADALEQATDVPTGPGPERTQAPAEADPADAAEQDRALDAGDDDRR